jgi:hypothetical protein
VNIAHPSSFDPGVRLAIQSRSHNPPNQQVMRPNFVVGRKIRITRALIFGNLIAIFN